MKPLLWLTATVVIIACAPAGRAVPRRVGQPKQDARWEPSVNIQTILDETDILPPPLVLGTIRPQRLSAAKLPRYSSAVMAAYRVTYTSLHSLKNMAAAQPERHRLIRAILDAMKTLEKHSHPLTDTLRATGAPLSPKLKAKLFKDQRLLAGSMHELREALEALEEAGKRRDDEPSRRWQANYDFVRARLMMRIVILHEYNLMLGMARRDALPPLAEGQSQWRIISVSGLHSNERECRLLNGKIKTILSRLIDDHANTPWAFLARRDLALLFGLDWVPAQ